MTEARITNFIMSCGELVFYHPLKRTSDCLAEFAGSSFADRDMAIRHRGGGIGHVDRAQHVEAETYHEDNDHDGEAEEVEDGPDGWHESRESGAVEDATGPAGVWPVDESETDEDPEDDQLDLEDSDTNDVVLDLDDD